MKKSASSSTSISIIFLLVLFTLQATAQPTTDWVARYNGPANKADQARAMVIDAQNNIYVTGSSEGKKGNLDYATVKYNAAGVQQWVARYNGTGNGEDWPYAIAVDEDGNVYVTGRSLGNGTGPDYATVKYNELGVQLWAERYAGPANLVDMGKDIQVDAAGNVYVTGLCDGNSVSGNAYVTIKYNSAGALQWLARFDGILSGQEDANSVAVDATGNVYVTGRSAGIVTVKYDAGGQQQWIRNGGGSNGTKVLIDAGNNIIVTGWGSKTVKYNSGGDLLWEATYAPGAAFQDMVLDASDNVYITGYNRENGTSDDYRTVKYDVSGNQQWSARFNGSFNGIDLARSIALDGSGNIYVTGHCTVNDGSRNGGTNYATVKYDNTGAEQWVALYDNPDKPGSDGFAVAVDALDNVYVTGQSATKTSYFDFTTIKYSQSTASKIISKKSIPENSSVYNFQLRNYPNPFNQTTSIEYQLPIEGKVKLSIHDLFGREITTLVHEYKPAGTHLKKFAANNLSPGTYFYRIHSGEFVETRKLLILK